MFKSDGLCRSSAYDDFVVEPRQKFETYARKTTPGLGLTTRLRHSIYDVNEIRSHPSDHPRETHLRPTPMLSGSLLNMNEPSRDMSDNIGSGRLLYIPRLDMGDPLIQRLPFTFDEVEGDILVSVDGELLLATTDPDIVEVAQGDPSSPLDGNIVVTSDNKSVVLANLESVSAANDGNMPVQVLQDIKNLNDNIVVDPQPQNLYGITDISADPVYDGIVDVRQLYGPREHFHADVFHHDGHSTELLFAGGKFSRRKGFKRGRRTKSDSARRGRKSRAAAKKKLRQARKKRRNLRKMKKQAEAEKASIRKRIQEIKALNKKEEQEQQRIKQESEKLAEAEMEMKKEADELERLLSETSSSESAQSGQVDTYYHHGSNGSTYSMMEMPKMISIKGSGFVSNKKPKETVGLSKVFHQKVMGLSPESHKKAEMQALNFFRQEFGIPVEKSIRSKNGTYTMKNQFSIIPYGVKSTFNTKVNHIDDADDTQDHHLLKKSTVHEGGWKLVIQNPKGALIKGRFAGNKGKTVDNGTNMKWGHWVIEQPKGKIPVVIHFESSEPTEIPDQVNSGKPVKEQFNIDYADPMEPISEIEDLQMGTAFRNTVAHAQDYTDEDDNLTAKLQTTAYLNFE